MPKHLISGKQSKPENVCADCGRREPSFQQWSDGSKHYERYCNICKRKHERQNWTDKQFLRYIPERFLCARIENLPKALQTQINQLTDDTGLFLWGAPGVGKTYAMTALMRQYLNDGFECLRVNWEELCLSLRDTYKPNSKKTEFDIIKKLVEVDKLFIEDIGTTVSNNRQESDFNLRTLLVTLDKRLECCRATFITTNKSVEQLGDSFDQRIASRLQQACIVIRLAGQDKRKQV